MAELDLFLLLSQADVHATDVAVDFRLGGNHPPRLEYTDAVGLVLGQRSGEAGIQRVTFFLTYP